MPANAVSLYYLGTEFRRKRAYFSLIATEGCPSNFWIDKMSVLIRLVDECLIKRRKPSMWIFKFPITYQDFARIFDKRATGELVSGDRRTALVGIARHLGRSADIGSDLVTDSAEFVPGLWQGLESGRFHIHAAADRIRYP